MELEEFFKNQYDTSLEEKAEINNSLSTPIGILTALIAWLFFAATSFDFHNSPFLSLVFIVISGLSAVMLVRSIFHLVKAYSDFHKGYDYGSLSNSDILDDYYRELVQYYTARSEGLIELALVEAKRDFDDYVLKELITYTGINQRNNKTKTYHKFKSHHYMILSFISLGLLIIPYGIDLEVNKGKEKVQLVKVDSIISVNLMRHNAK